MRAKTSLLHTASEWLSGTLLWGDVAARGWDAVGPHSEISTIIDVVPELVESARAPSCADGIYLGGPRVHRGTVSRSPQTRIGRTVSSATMS